jgi:4-amino-4-deoxy-L-arabinose transferase-like glycosyltransferase
VYHGSLKPRTAGLGFGALSVFFLAVNLIWLRLDRSPPAWDDSFYLTNSLIMHDALAEGGLAEYARQFRTIMGIKPPLIAVLPTPVYLIVGRKPRAALLVNLGCLLLLFATLYHLGKKYAGRRAGLIAVAIVGSMPMIYGLSRWYLVECGLTAIVALGIALIGEWKDSAGLQRLFLLGIICGFGLLMKFSFPVYLLIPLLYFAVRERGAFFRPKPLMVFVPPAVVLALPWYAFNLRPELATALRAGNAETGRLYETGDIFSLADIARYLGNTFNAGPALYFVALPVLSLAFSRVSSAGRRGLLICALWGSPILFLTFGHYRDLRYAAPLFPALALALGILASAAWEKRGTAVLVCLALALALLSMLQTSFGLLGNRRLELGGLLFVAPKFDYARQFNRTRWPHQEILADLHRTSSFQGGERKTLIVGTDSVWFNADNFELTAVEMKLPFQVGTTAYETELNHLIPFVDSAAYFIYEENARRMGPFNSRYADALKEVRESGKFSELPIARRLPDSGTLHVFANISPKGFTWSGAFLPSGIERVADCNITFDRKLQLTGLSMKRTPESLEVKYRWRCLKPVDRAYWCFTHIVDAAGAVVGYLDHEILNGQPPTSHWKAQDTAIEDLVYRFPEVQKGGSVQLRVGVFDRNSGERLPITATDFQLTDRGTAALVSEAQLAR